MLNVEEEYEEEEEFLFHSALYTQVSYNKNRQSVYSLSII